MCVCPSVASINVYHMVKGNNVKNFRESEKFCRKKNPHLKY